MSYDEKHIASYNKLSFKNLVKRKTSSAAFTFLNGIKNNQSKIKNINYQSFSIQPYLKSESLTHDQSKLLANLRANMIEVKVNRKSLYSDLSCALGCTHVDSQDELLNCEPLLKKLQYKINPNTQYKHIYSSKIEKQKKITELLSNLLTIRKEMLEN